MSNNHTTRRDFLAQMNSGLTGIALAQLLGSASLAETISGGTHHPPKAKRVLQIFCPGAASHIDLWDYRRS